jgi:hypothetical protein
MHGTREFEVIAYLCRSKRKATDVCPNNYELVRSKLRQKNHWTKPPEGWAKLNFDVVLTIREPLSFLHVER